MMPALKLATRLLLHIALFGAVLLFGKTRNVGKAFITEHSLDNCEHCFLTELDWDMH
jgi:hypothetical protein